jgi:hypothetical protein
MYVPDGRTKKNLLLCTFRKPGGEARREEEGKGV